MLLRIELGRRERAIREYLARDYAGGLAILRSFPLFSAQSLDAFRIDRVVLSSAIQ